ncbi:MAG: helix-turn-helix domain-containing protein [Pseudomonadales bacterium]|nr:helix-turn-helix domain-containing protein [Pseudomonadales bacterium]
MSHFATTTANQLWSFTCYLLEQGIDVEAYLTKHKLPLLLLNNPQIKIPTRLVFQFLDDVAKQENLPLLGWQVGQHVGWQALADISQQAAEAATLIEAFSVFINLASTGASHADFFIYEEEHDFEFCHVSGVSLDTPGYFHVESYLMAVFIDLVRQLSDNHAFKPLCLKLRSQTNAALTDHDAINILFDQDYTALRIPQSMRNAPCHTPQNNNPPQEPDKTLPNFSTLEAFTSYPAIASLSTLLVPYLLEGTPSIQFIADIGDTSVRSLQRLLSSQGCSFNQLVQLLRGDMAKLLLLDNRYSVADVARLLQYQQTTHFIRAFKKITETTPKQFNLSHQQPLAELAEN